MTTGRVYHELYMWHDPGLAATRDGDRQWIQVWERYEHPETKRRFPNLIEWPACSTSWTHSGRGQRPATRSCAFEELMPGISSVRKGIRSEPGGSSTLGGVGRELIVPCARASRARMAG